MAARIRTRPLGSTLAILVVVSLLAGLVAVVISVRQELPVSAAPGPGPYDVPQVVDTNPAPNIVETDITAQAATIDVGGGLLANMWTFNGTVPGPQFRLKVGDTVIVHFKNLLPEPTGIHWHGIEVPNASDGTSLTQNQVATNDTFVYKFIVPRPGVFWYHPHHHASTNHVSRGLYGSMIITDNASHESTLVANGVLPSAAQTKTLVISDTTVCAAHPDPSPLCSAPIDHHGALIGTPLAAGEIPNIQVSVPATVDEGRTLLTNGVVVGARAGTPTSPGALDAGAFRLNVQAGQGLRLQLVNAATMRFVRLALTDDSGAPVTLFRVGGEGGLLDEAIVEGGVIGGYDTRSAAGEIVLAPGDRADVVAVIPPAATGVLTLWTLPFVRSPDGAPVPPTAPVAHFNVSGSASTPYTIANGTDLLIAPSVNAPIEALPAPTATLLDPSTFSPTKPGLAAQNIGLTSAPDDHLGVDNVQGTHDAPGQYTAIAHMASARYAKVGDVLELTVTNETTIPTIDHPFHLHGFSIQPISLKPWPGAAAPVPTAEYIFPYREFVDEINIPYKYMLTFRVRLDDRPQMDGTTPGGALGRWIFHCHLFAHATFGMMSELDVVAANGNERPYVNADNTPVAGNQSATLTNTGTWRELDGDAVTLSASIGTVVKDPGGAVGTWAWSLTAPAGAPDLVYITATDAGGRKNQAVFALDVNDPPAVTIGAGQATSIVEGTTLNVAANFTDVTLDAPYTATINFGAGAGPQSVTPTITDNIAPIAGTIAGSFQYPNDGVYSVTLTVSDSQGATGSASFPVTVTNFDPGGNTPSAPQIVIATPTTYGASVLFSPPLDNGGSNITKYTVSCTSSNGGPFGSKIGTSIPITVTGLASPFRYTCLVTATNATGTGVPSSPSNAFVPLARRVPGAARTVSAVPGNGRATLRWLAPLSNGGAAITGYVVTPYIGSRAGSARTFKSAATNATVIGLANGKTYRFKVAARNAVGNGPASSLSNAVTVGAPLAPRSPSATAGNRMAKVKWATPASNNGSPVTAYVVTPYKAGVAQRAVIFASTARVGTVTGLASGGKYMFRVAAANRRGVGVPSPLSNMVKPT